MSLVSWDILRGSFPARSGAARMAQGHVRAIFVAIHAAVADFQHVGIIPLARSGKRFQSVLRKTDEGHAVIFIADISGCPPEVARLRPPMPGSLHAPISNAEDDGSSCLFYGIAKLEI